MSTPTDPVELLERAIGYARGTLATVTDDLMCRPTPCAQWDLADLLAHMSDGLDAFTEASRGMIEVGTAPPAATQVGILREKACTLLGAWIAPSALVARLGAATLGTGTVLQVAALEVTVHGWDVGQATGAGMPIPSALASSLLPVARDVVSGADRGPRFGAPVPPPSDSADDLLLAHLGRAAWSWTGG